MGDPGAVEAVAASRSLSSRTFARARSLTSGSRRDGDERRHAADGVRAAPVAGLHEQLGVGAHERDGHRDLGAVGQDHVGPRPELLDDAEDVVPAAGVEAGGVVAQLVEDLVHLEGGEDRLDEHGRPDRSRAGCPAPPGPTTKTSFQSARLEVALELRQVEVRARSRASSSSRALWKKQSPKSKRLAEIGAPSTGRAPPARCQPRGRTHSVAIASFRAYASHRSGRSSAPANGLAAGAQCPSTTFDQVGESASSRSAMKTDAPLLSALIIIFGSAGPVISTRRSSKSGGAGATRQSGSRLSIGFGRKSGVSPASRRSWRRARSCSSSPARD